MARASVTEPYQPEFSDNREGRTLQAALSGYMDWLAADKKEPVSLSIATGYFNPGGFALIADQLEKLANVRPAGGGRAKRASD